ncbi:hypothetical protein SAMD00019534_000310 [Acytostelium subglobosum LB1]|uniref:hypothetical protein n=1 Tax=Acytostelium subglobosum LB1 TaxID=1410327 RepID=UPI000644D226|nr:hypothetical protein SAMD00019534_000310 [Acytostelium subglobosum LB1]GAM16856.1 hypothetical protein SAMD00019534_000310 [Acytostelium subglobosum LB1]|eukprot:XP_012758918.1 hypothetical protein SAMD00019534_000310 [Acytostelium subglobosum LB1]
MGKDSKRKKVESEDDEEVKDTVVPKKDKTSKKMKKQSDDDDSDSESKNNLKKKSSSKQPDSEDDNDKDVKRKKKSMKKDKNDDKDMNKKVKKVKKDNEDQDQEEDKKKKKNKVEEEVKDKSDGATRSNKESKNDEDDKKKKKEKKRKDDKEDDEKEHNDDDDAHADRDEDNKKKKRKRPKRGHSSYEDQPNIYMTSNTETSKQQQQFSIDVDRLIQQKPWLSMIRDFSKVIWSEDDGEPNIVVVHSAEECCRIVTLLPSIFHQEQGSSAKSVVTFGKSSKQASVPSTCVVGFDTEGSDMPYSVQLSTLTVAAVIYIKEIDHLPQPLVQLLENKYISKAGVGVTADFDSLIAFGKAHKMVIKPRGSLDVSCVAGFNGVTQSYLSLDNLAVDLLNTKKYQRMIGSVTTRMYHDEFHKYAAIDAWLGFKIAMVLHQYLKNKLAFYEWTQAQQTGNYRVPIKEKSGKQEQSAATTPPVVDSTQSSSSSTSQTQINVISYNKTNAFKQPVQYYDERARERANPYFVKGKDEEKQEAAQNHFYLQKLQHIKEGQRRPFI